LTCDFEEDEIYKDIEAMSLRETTWIKKKRWKFTKSILMGLQSSYT